LQIERKIGIGNLASVRIRKMTSFGSIRKGKLLIEALLGLAPGKSESLIISDSPAETKDARRRITKRANFIPVKNKKFAKRHGHWPNIFLNIIFFNKKL
jgi:hypothetical protein